MMDRLIIWFHRQFALRLNSAALCSSIYLPTGSAFLKSAWKHVSSEIQQVVHEGLVSREFAAVDLGSVRELSIADILVIDASLGRRFANETADKLNGKSSGSWQRKAQRAVGYGRAFHGSFATVYTDAEMSFYFKSSFFASIHVTTEGKISRLSRVSYRSRSRSSTCQTIVSLYF